MAIAAKPRKQDTAPAVNIDALISKGGSTAAQDEDKDEVLTFTLRLPRDLARRIDVAAKSRKIKPSRHTWILEAIHEKLEGEGG
jgi:predicted HicB family RNase H-like nuclease